MLVEQYALILMYFRKDECVRLFELILMNTLSLTYHFIGLLSNIMMS